MITMAMLSGSALAQTNIDTTLDRYDLAQLDRLVVMAQTLDPTIAGIIAVQQTEAALLERLRDALSLTISGSVAGDIYGQAQADYRISIGLDVLKLLPDAQQEAQAAANLDTELRRVRLATVEAFVRYRIAEERADAAALALESAQTDYRVVQAQHTVGDRILADVLAARSNVGSAAVALLTANGEVVIALEALAATVGLDVRSTRELLGDP
jgi:outer membrane protein TolC